jgi:hypothetical protein
MKLQAMVGYKLFKETVEDGIDLIRIVHCDKKFKDDTANPPYVIIRHEDTGETEKIKVEDLKGYTPLEPDGLLTFNIVNVYGEDKKINKDVVVTASKILNLKIGDNVPYAICRQSITDIFYNMIATTEDHDMVGLAVNQDTCPANFDFHIMLIASDIPYSEHINFYRNDMLLDLLVMVNKSKFDTVLTNLYETHAKTTRDPRLKFKDKDKGWCKTLRGLLIDNSFQTDIDQMLGITAIDFLLEDYIEKKPLPGVENETYDSLIPELKKWLSYYIAKDNINDITVLEYDHDIDLADFNNSKYFLLRDKSNKLYLVVYTTEGEYLEQDLYAELSKSDFSTKFRLDFYSKYINDNNARVK